MARKIKSKVKLSEIVFDKSLYPRSQYNWQTGYDYSQSMKCGAKFPPIVLALFNGKKYLVDGKHRIEATRINKIDKIDAIVITGLNKKQIFIESIKHNIAHGRVLSPYEKRGIAIRLMEMKIKDSEISQLIQVPSDKMEKFVGDRLVNTITGEDVDSEGSGELAREIGQAILKSGVKHFSGQVFTNDQFSDLEKNQKDFSMNSQRTLLEHVVKIFKSNLLDKGDAKVMALVVKLKTLLRKY